jgi:predicted nucleic acid-binding protein
VIVVDTNVVAYLYLPSDWSAHAEALLRHDPDWAAPVLWRSEFRSILAGYLRRGALTFEQACAIQAEAEDLLAGNEHDMDSADVLRLVRDSECSAYDCEFAALAADLGARLVTMDRKLLGAFPARAVSLKTFTASR